MPLVLWKILAELCGFLRADAPHGLLSKGPLGESPHQGHQGESKVREALQLTGYKSYKVFMLA